MALVATVEELPRCICIMGMEAYMSAHFVSRTLRKMGFESQFIPAIYVQPFNNGQKNDYNDAEAIAEAALRPNLKTVSEKTQEQLDLQALHRVWSHLVSRRTATMNQIRTFLIEQGITVRKSEASCQRLMTIPGIGPIISTAVVAAVGNGEAYDRGRDFAAWLRLVPRQHSTGGSTVLGRITKRGSRYLRMLFVQAARVIMMRPKNWPKFSFGQ